MGVSTIKEAIVDIKSGKMIILVDDEDRENEGDLCMAAEFVTPEAVNFMATHARGLVCLGLPAERMRQLGIAPEGFEWPRFIEGLVLPAYQQGIARLLELATKLGRLAAGMPTEVKEVNTTMKATIDVDWEIAIRKAYGQTESGLNTPAGLEGKAETEKAAAKTPREMASTPLTPTATPTAAPRLTRSMS